MNQGINEPIELVWDTRCTTAESVSWDAARRRVMFCDIPAGRIFALAPDSGARTTWDLRDGADPAVVASFGLCRSGRLVVALRRRVVLWDPETARMQDLTPSVDEPDTNRLNDGKVGPDGAFWVGSMDTRKPREATASLYRVTPDGRIERKSEGYSISNGLAWSPDGRTMYHSDTTPGIVEAWDFDPATGRISNRRRFVTLTDEEGRPDGGATDAEGCYWSAGVSAGCLNRFSPEGRLMQKVPMPVPSPTMPCFAEGSLYTTSLREGKDEETLARAPQSGGLHRMRAPVAGSPVSLFADN